MIKFSPSTKIFFGLLVVLALCAAVIVYLPMGSFGVTAGQSPELSKIPLHVLALANTGIVLVFYGILGFLGILLARKKGFPEIWDEKISTKQRFYIPGLIGAVGGVSLVIGDIIFSRYNTIGHFIHPPFPTSLVASLSAGIGEEIIFRLFFISFWFWLLSFFFRKHSTLLFWIVSGVSALAFTAGHFPAFIYLYGYQTFGDIPIGFVWEIVLLNGIIGLLSAWQFKKAGFLGAVGVHFWTDVVWHVIWGLLLLI